MACQSVAPSGETTAVAHPEVEVTSEVAEATSQVPLREEDLKWADVEATATKCTRHSKAKSEEKAVKNEWNAVASAVTRQTQKGVTFPPQFSLADAVRRLGLFPKTREPALNSSKNDRR